MSTITEEQLQKRAEEIALEKHPRPTEAECGMLGLTAEEAFHRGIKCGTYERATLEALRIEAESLRLLEQNATHDLDCSATIDYRCVCGLSAHITALKSRLGIKP